MRIARIKIENFRGVSSGELLFSEHNVLVGDNNTGKSTILEAIDLVLGPERLARHAAIDEHDFYAGKYIDGQGRSIPIKVEVVIVDLSDEQKRHFMGHIEWWDTGANTLLEGPPASGTDATKVAAALRVGFTGIYDADEDDFIATTYFLSPVEESGEQSPFKTVDKRLCGFLFLRTLRTGSRALSLEHGSLLDIILKLKETRLKMWEDVLSQLRILAVAEKPELGINDILSTVQESLRLFISSGATDSPHIRVSDLTRENLRKTLTVFMDTGAKQADGSVHSAPFQHQGTGTINMLVLALLSLIAELMRIPAKMSTDSGMREQ